LNVNKCEEDVGCWMILLPSGFLWCLPFHHLLREIVQKIRKEFFEIFDLKSNCAKDNVQG
jgi:hypothetical protein